MRYVIPFKTLDEATLSLDNGGRFFNFLTSANDGIITSAEVGKVAGLFMEKQKTVLYLAMCISGLNSEEKQQVEMDLSEEFKVDYEKYLPKFLLASEAKKNGTLGANAVVTGIPHYIESKEDFTGFVIVPVMVGKVITMIPIPIIDKYDVYRIKDDNSSETFLVAHAKTTEKLPEKRMSLGGNLKELKLRNKENAPADMYLEVIYISEALI